MGGYLAMNAMCNSAGEFNTAKHCRCPRNRRDLSVRCITQDASVGSLSLRERAGVRGCRCSVELGLQGVGNPHLHGSW